MSQSALLVSDSACCQSGPFAPRALPRFVATIALSDAQPWSGVSYVFPHATVEHDSATLGLSGSCALDRDAPFHSTPEGQITACAYASVICTGFTVFGQLAAPAFRVSRPAWIHFRYGSPLRGAEASTS